jgi:integrase
MPSIRRHGAGYQARYRDPAGRQRGKTFRTKREASAFLARVEADKQRGTFVDPQLSRVRFEDWAAEWWETSTSHLKPRTREGYLSLLRRHLVPAFGRYPLQAITPPQVKSFITTLDRQGMSASRQRQTYRLLSLILKAAVEAGCLGRSPCIGVKIKRHQPPEQVILTPEQVGLLANALGTPNDLLCYVLAFGGLRWGRGCSSQALAVRRSEIENSGCGVPGRGRRPAPFRRYENLRAPMGQAAEIRGADAQTTSRNDC